MKFISCQECNKKLLKIGNFDRLSIKCPRCKTLNHLSAVSATSEDRESQTKQGQPRGHTQKDPNGRPQSTRQKWL
ncbi:MULTISPECIES: Com family DNA-binding transcriptional regulator [unclassified Psychrobacter]|uniref:Com family DNA-binding transcriptional regulator n=1 Tax=unclassified Psychrobacter TaxID=196806 RepID=UPI0018F7CB65